MARSRFPGVLLLAGALASCAPRAPPPDLSLDPRVLLEQVQAAAARVVSVSGEARLRAKGESRVAVQAFVAAQKPDRLRIEIVDFFGNSAAILASAGGRLAIYDARGGAFYRGAATPENVARLVRLRLRPEELVAVLCGWPLLGGDPVRADPGRGEVTLEVREGTGSVVARVIAGGALSSARVRSTGGGYDVAWRDRVPVDGAPGPGDMVLSSERPPVEVELSWTEVQANGPLRPSLFELRPPAGARIVDLDAGFPLPPALFPGEAEPGS